MTAQNEENVLGLAKTKAAKGKKKATGAARSADKAPGKPESKAEPKPKTAKKTPKAAKTPRSAKVGKGDKIVELLQRTGGATIKELTAATEWQPHSVRGYLSGVLRKKQGLHVVSSVNEGVYSYAIKS